MSVEAITWALKQDVPNSSAKFVLVVLANCASGDTFRAWPSAAYLSRATGQNRKTILASLARLVAQGLIRDTGKRAGDTKSIPVYALEVAANFASSTENGTAQAVPILEASSPNLGRKQSLKRDTDTLEPSGKQRQPPVAGMPTCPSWVEAAAWEGFVEMRKRSRFPMTTRAAELVIAELVKLRDAGADPNAVLDQSTRNGWRDVFPIRLPQGSAPFGRPEPTPQHQPEARAVIEAARAKRPANPAVARAMLDDLSRTFSR